MRLNKLSLINYKNIDDLSFSFENKINCFVGRNGIGKTNILDAIYHLAYGKSYFNPLATQNIKHDCDFFVIDAEFTRNERPTNIICSLKKGQKKVIKHNGKAYDKLSEHIGLIPLVLISPSDRDLIVEGSETRRSFMDIIISQLDTNYLTDLINYQKTVKQRNSLLKYFSLNQTFDRDNLYIYNDQLHLLGHKIHEKRKSFISDFNPYFIKIHRQITDANDAVQLIYESQLENNNLADLFQVNEQKDRVLQHTSCGIHKDDLVFTIDDYPIKKFGSQGQQKSYLIALKLAKFEFLKQQSGIKPILLFDDIFDKLDAQRVERIIEMVNSDSYGQLFISDTHPERTEELVRSINHDYKLFNL